MKKFLICVFALVFGLMARSAFAQVEYGTDFLEIGNPGGWTSSLKTWNENIPKNSTTPTTPAWVMTAGESISIDIWLKDVPQPLVSAGVWIDYDYNALSITSVGIYDNGTGGTIPPAGTYGSLPGPWDKDMTAAAYIGSGPDATGTILITVGTTGQVNPDLQDDIIFTRVTFECISGGTNISFRANVNGDFVVDILSTIYDSTIVDAIDSIYECLVNEDCEDDGLWCNGTETCVDGACVGGTDPCPDDGEFCNGEEGCDEENDVCIPGTNPCPDDGQFCNGDEICNEIDNQCEQINVPCSDDGDPCTDICDEPTDTCNVCNATAPDDECCTTSDACTAAEVCLVEYNDFYVNGTDGDNTTNDGLSPGNAWKTITHALNTIPTSITLDDNNRATVHVAGSIYDRTMGGGDAETFPIYMVEYISLFGDGYEDTIIDAGGDAYPINNVIMFAQEDYIQNVTVDGFTITGGYAYGGGGIMINWANPVISNCNITGNIAYGMNGGGIYNKRSNAIISNCIIADNQAPAQRGGGISCGNQSHPVITNCTIVNNLSGSLEWEGGGGLYTAVDSNPTITNCIFWGNEGNDPTTPEDESQILAREGSGIVVNYSCIDGGWSGSGTGNTDQDPNFFGTGYHLMYGSSCIDSADSGLTTEIPETDIGEYTRYDHCPTTDTGVGPFTYYDRGAWEYQGDSDLDGILDDADSSCIVGDSPCSGGVTEGCDDNCTYTPNPAQEDVGDGDGVGDVCDICLIAPDGIILGTCGRTINPPGMWIILGNTCTNDGDCGVDGFCLMNQEDSNQNGIGDACECEADLNTDDAVEGLDILIYKAGYPRSYYLGEPCALCIGGSNDGAKCLNDAECPDGDCGMHPTDPCLGDLNCDMQVNGFDTLKFKEDYPRTEFLGEPCPHRPELPYCVY